MLLLAAGFYACHKVDKPEEPDDGISEMVMKVKGCPRPTGIYNVGTFYFYVRSTDFVSVDWGDRTPIDTMTLLIDYNQFHHVYSDTSVVYIVKITGTNITNLYIPAGDYFNFDTAPPNGYLMHLDVSKNTMLASLGCGYNRLTSLDLGKNSALAELECEFNRLTSLDVSGCTALTYIHCNSNKIKILDVSKNTALYQLRCDSNQLKSLDLSKNTELHYLDCSRNQLTSLDISKNTALTGLLCGVNQLTSLNTTNNTKLGYLNCSRNQLTNLDLSKNMELGYLYCEYNQLTSFDAANNTKLGYLNCSHNQLTSLDLSKNIWLTFLEIKDNVFPAEALNDLFETLQSNVGSGNYINIGSNPGSYDCDKSIAENKGWMVY